MAVLSILKFGNPILKEKGFTVGKVDGELKTLIDNLAETMYAAPGLGLAAVQIGILKQVFVYDVGDGLEVVINPKIVQAFGDQLEEDESCLSIPEIHVPVKRFEKIELSGLDSSGKDIIIKADGLLARAIQHEMDHLDGCLILDRTPRHEKRKAIQEYNKLSGLI